MGGSHLCLKKARPPLPPPIPPSTFSGDSGMTAFTVVKVGISILNCSWSAFIKPVFLCERERENSADQCLGN